jgi:hypothetical protein
MNITQTSEENQGPVKLVLDQLDGVEAIIEGVSWKARCPVHGDRNPSLTVSVGHTQPVAIYCHAGCSTEDVVEAIGLSMADLCGPTCETTAYAPPQKQTADPDLCDRVYSKFLKSLTRVKSDPDYKEQIDRRNGRDNLDHMREHHPEAEYRKELKSRGLSADGIERGHYHVLRWQRSRKDWESLDRLHLQPLVDEFGPDLGKVPGFWQEANGAWHHLNLDGLLIPCFDPEGRIVGLEVRPRREKGENGPKYITFSRSENKLKPPPSVHLLPGTEVKGRTLRVTEGRLKANVAADLDQDNAYVGMGGTGGVKSRFPSLLDLIQKQQPARVQIALDMDEAGRKATATLSEMLKTAGVPHDILEWDPRHKGVDDLLLANRRRDPDEETPPDLVITARPVVIETPAPTPKDSPRPQVTGRRSAEPGQARKLVRRNLNEAIDVPIMWLWKDRLPEGFVVILDGLAGQGKTFIAGDLIARITTGRPMPGDGGPDEPDPGKVRNVMFLSTEDDYGRVIKARVKAAGGDPRRVYHYDENTPPNLSHDMDDFEEFIREEKIALVVLDPLFGFLGGLNKNSEDEMRPLMEKLKGVAQRTGAVILCLRHLSKNHDADATQAGLGASCITAVPRVQYVVSRDPDGPEDERSGVIAVGKFNLGKAPPSLRYRIESEETTVGGVKADVGRVEWGETSELTANALLRSRRDSFTSPFTQNKPLCRVWLRDHLELSGPTPSNVVVERGRLAGYSRRTVMKAANEVQVDRHLDMWSLPEKVATPSLVRATPVTSPSRNGTADHAVMN